MVLDPTVTLGNILTIMAMVGGGVYFLASVGFKLGQIISKLELLARTATDLDSRITRLESQIIKPIHERRIR